MDLSIVVKNLWWFIAIILVLQVLRTSWFKSWYSKFKGWYGEFKVKVAAYFVLNKSKYRAFHNVLLNTSNDTTQIDHIFVSRYGIFVVETKNMKGRIFGEPSQATWTQRIYGNNYPFQNPLRQNYKHTKALEALIDVPEHAIYSVIIFVGRSTFGTIMPEEVTHGAGSLIRYIKSRKRLALTSKQVQAATSVIESNRQKATHKTQREHVNKIQSRPICHKCGSLMVLRTAKKDANSGQKFWGCSQYPGCRSTQPLSQ